MANQTQAQAQPSIDSLSRKRIICLPPIYTDTPKATTTTLEHQTLTKGPPRPAEKTSGCVGLQEVWTPSAEH